MHLEQSDLITLSFDRPINNYTFFKKFSSYFFEYDHTEDVNLSKIITDSTHIQK